MISSFVYTYMVAIACGCYSVYKYSFIIEGMHIVNTVYNMLYILQ